MNDWLRRSGNTIEQEKAQCKAGHIANRLAHSHLVILDELGYLPFSVSGGALLSHLLNTLYKRISVVITTNLSFCEWATVFGEPNIQRMPPFSTGWCPI